MAEKRSKGFIQLEWECPNCSSRNPGPVKTCQNCGAPQPENVEFVQPAEQKLVTDEKTIGAAKAGADIHCGFCGTRNPATATVCSQCGADLKEGKARQAGRVLQPAVSRAVPKSVRCTNCDTENPSTNTTCSKCGAPLPRAIAPQPAVVQPMKAPLTAPKKAAPWLWVGGIVVMLLCACFAAWYFFLAPAVTLQATVTDVLWQTSVPLQVQQEVRHNDQAGSPPSDAYDVSCRTDTEQICEQKTVDRGNGYAEIVEECHDQSTQYCSYTVTEWETIQTYTLDGHDLFPVYADPSIASGQRTGSPSEDYTVYFDTAQGIKTYSPGDLDEFQQFQVGSVWTLKLSRTDAILSVEP